MPGKKHTHKYNKIEIAGQKVWSCALDDCSHYMPYYLRQIMPGKGSLCWNCGNKFILTEPLMERERPICMQCDLKERGINLDVNNIDDIIAMIGQNTKDKTVEK